MVNKRKVREVAMQVLYLWDANNSDDADAARRVAADGSEDDAVRRAALEMATQTWSQRQASDAWVERLAPQWPPRRQPPVDRNILRLAVWELTNAHTPPKVVIDEAIELAKEFSTEQSAAFVNGVLDAVLKEKNALTEGKPGASSPEPEGETPPAPAAGDGHTT
jgi:N utilization substance protein B